MPPRKPCIERKADKQSRETVVDALVTALKALSAAIFAPNDHRSPELQAAMELTIAALKRAERRE